MIVSISFFYFNTNKFWAFKQMVEAKRFINKTKNITFYKMLGTGAEGGFIMPDFGVYSLLCVWNNKKSAINFLNKSDHASQISKKAEKRVDYIMSPIMSNGLWDKINPFDSGQKIEIEKENKIGVITRGKIKLSKQIDFWLNVPAAAKSIRYAKGVEFYKGIGELPFLSQATFSVWKDFSSISNFAYKNKAHAEIIKKTRDRGWYSEDLFARFKILSEKTIIF